MSYANDSHMYSQMHVHATLLYVGVFFATVPEIEQFDHNLLQTTNNISLRICFLPKFTLRKLHICVFE